MNNRPMLAIMGTVLMGFGIYILKNPRAVRDANRTGRIAIAGWGNKPIWVFRLVGILCLLGAAAFIYTALTMHSN